MVATELLDRIFRRHQPIGEALRAVREMYGRTSPTFYPYLFYGDVTAQMPQTPHSRAPTRCTELA